MLRKNNFIALAFVQAQGGAIFEGNHQRAFRETERTRLFIGVEEQVLAETLSLCGGQDSQIADVILVRFGFFDIRQAKENGQQSQTDSSRGRAANISRPTD